MIQATTAKAAVAKAEFPAVRSAVRLRARLVVATASEGEELLRVVDMYVVAEHMLDERGVKQRATVPKATTGLLRVQRTHCLNDHMRSRRRPERSRLKKLMKE